MMSACKSVSGVLMAASLMLINHPEVCADTIAQFSFDNAANPTENTGIGSDGELLGGASVSDGRLVVSGLDQALDIPLGELSPFNGDTDWSVSFDFATTGNPTNGALFSSDGSGEEPFPAGQEGALNIYLEEGNVLMDFWFIGAIGTESGNYNDDSMHRLEASYEAATGLATLTLDGTETESSDEFMYSRDSTIDRTRVGDETNPDFGGEFNPVGFSGYLDNVLIEGTPAIPEPSSVLLMLIGAMPLLSCRSRRRRTS